MTPRPPRSTRYDTLFPSTTRFRSRVADAGAGARREQQGQTIGIGQQQVGDRRRGQRQGDDAAPPHLVAEPPPVRREHQDDRGVRDQQQRDLQRSEEHTSELQSLMRNSYAGFSLKNKKAKTTQ